jgi:hypothetical protein
MLENIVLIKSISQLVYLAANCDSTISRMTKGIGVEVPITF